MTADLERRRVLFLAGTLEGAVLQQHLAAVLQEHRWDLLLADSVARARFSLRHVPCDVLLVEEGLYRQEGPEGVAWLAAQHAAPVVLLVDWDADLVATALERGACLWLPRDQVLYSPRSVVSFLERAACLGDLRRQLQQVGEAYAASQRQLRELMEQVADLLPLDKRARWLPTGQLLGRLEEELERARRHGVPVSVALGEVQLRLDQAHVSPAALPLHRWVAQQVDRAKRLVDVGGNCGPRRFLLVLPHTLRAGAVACCRRIKAQLEDAPPKLAEFQPSVLVCFGVVTSPAGARDAKELLERAEKCLARARRGENEGIVAQ